MSVDLHRHDEFSLYDGSGKSFELAEIAKEKGYTALGLSNHGNTSGNIQHYDACHKYGLKPIMGVEAYFLPKWKEKNRGYHLCLFAKNILGYRNLNEIQTLADKQKYYNPIVDFKILEELHEGIICTSACTAGYLAQAIKNNEIPKAKRFLIKMQEIFGDDFYIEVQPYSISEKNVQEYININSIKLAKQLGIKCILTSDSHRGRKEDMPAYIKMHELKNNNPEYIEHIKLTYSERYMPDVNEMPKRFIKMHKENFGLTKATELAKEFCRNLSALEKSVDDNIIDDIAKIHSIPKFDPEQNSFELLKANVKKGLKQKGLSKNKEYLERAKEELKVIKVNNFEDYFLIVQDYILWAKNNNIAVGPGRGSGCNCLVNYLLGITTVDPILFKLDYRRFIRADKNSLPDIDSDFETARRPEVIEYIINKYTGKAVQIASYGMYRVKNLINDLVKLYSDLKTDKGMIKYISDTICSHEHDGLINIKELKADKKVQDINTTFKHIIDAFCMLYLRVKYMGTHAAGVAITKNDIFLYTAIRYDSKTGKIFSAYNLFDLERAGMVKYDILGLNTMSSIKEMRELTNDVRTIPEMVNDQKVIEAFGNGDSNGVFQYDRKAVQDLLIDIDTDCFNDVVATSAMNRPGPLKLGMPKIYAESKTTWENMSEKPVYAEYVDETYGCILYQEQVASIAVNLAGFSWNESDRLRKMDGSVSVMTLEYMARDYENFLAKFISGMSKHGVSEEEASELFHKFLNYTFNKGHAVGYAIISLEEMFYKVYYPEVYWYVKLKYNPDDNRTYRYMTDYVKEGGIVFLPHVNYTAWYSLRKFEGQNVIQQGISSIKNVGAKAADYIEEEKRKNGRFKNWDDFYDRCKSRVVTSRVVEALNEAGALDFNVENYMYRVKQYNIALYQKALNKK